MVRRKSKGAGGIYYTVEPLLLCLGLLPVCSAGPEKTLGQQNECHGRWKSVSIHLSGNGQRMWVGICGVCSVGDGTPSWQECESMKISRYKLALLKHLLNYRISTYYVLNTVPGEGIYRLACCSTQLFKSQVIHLLKITYFLPFKN